MVRRNQGQKENLASDCSFHMNRIISRLKNNTESEISMYTRARCVFYQTLLIHIWSFYECKLQNNKTLRIQHKKASCCKLYVLNYTKSD